MLILRPSGGSNEDLLWIYCILHYISARRRVISSDQCDIDGRKMILRGRCRMELHSHICLQTSCPPRYSMYGWANLPFLCLKTLCATYGPPPDVNEHSLPAGSGGIQKPLSSPALVLLWLTLLVCCCDHIPLSTVLMWLWSYSLNCLAPADYFLKHNIV